MTFQDMRVYSTGLLKASFQNKTTLNKLSTSEDGNLLFDGKEINGGLHEYSTEEHIVGTWINGKPIYEKTFIISDFDFSQSKDFTNDIFTEIELIIDAKMYDTTSSTVRFVHVDARKISSNTIRLYNKDNWASIDTYTLQYTKTTDY